jgi:ribonuclease E
VLESHTHQDGNREGAAGDERRRSRDRYGRDRRERGDRAQREDVPVGAELSPEEQAQAFVPEQPRAESPVAAKVPAPDAAAAQPPAGALPKVQSFELPVDQLQQVAQGSGLQWVNSNADKIAAVQAAIAAEPKPARTPRERPPVVVADEGPLVLVETRRDLRNLQLPFDEQPPQ